MSDWVERFFYPEHPDGAMRELAFLPLAVAEALFATGVRVRTAACAKKWLRPERVPGLRVVSVGNVLVGGTGKTPVVRALAERFAARGRPVAILSRGHGRASTADVRVEGPPWPPVERAGDEPLMLARSLPAATVWVGADRLALAKLAVRCGASVALLDDGFQHWRLGRDADVVVVDEAVGLGNGHLLPRGPLREPLSALGRATLLWVRAAEAPVPMPCPEGLPRVRARHGPRDVVDPAGEVHPADVLRGRRVVGFAGIGRPTAFRRTLESLGAEVVSFRGFPDHHPFHDDELRALERQASSAGAWLVTTEKDRVRCPEGAGVHVLRLGVEVLEGEEHLERLVSGV
ncbi:MAG TPA: tetraacyldisaccharide 4'-kinase [Myxococcaceae bacterium]|nr:tetraacyldisaccharide 4'-kinase [Myxococcaceae bacterium]